MKQSSSCFFFTVLAVLLFQSCMVLDSHLIRGNGKITTKEIKIPDYRGITIAGPAEIVYEQLTNKEPYLQIRVDENILPLLEIKVENNKLVIRPKEKRDNLQPSQFKIYTNSLNLEDIEIAGSGDIRLKGEVNSKKMDIEIAGSGDVVADSLFCERLDLSIAGSGNARLKGAGNEAELEIAGSGSIKGYDFSVQDLSCEIAGSGNIEITAGKSIRADIAGSGDIKYKGNPQVKKSVAGSGNVQKVN